MLDLDPEIKNALVALIGGTSLPKIARGDWQSHRQKAEAGLGDLLQVSEDVHVEDFSFTADDGEEIPMRWYKRVDSVSKAAILYTHGGGKIAGSIDTHDAVCRYYTANTGVGVLSVGFRLSPEYPFPIPAEDSYSGLLWLSEHAADLGVDPNRIGVAGDSGGGGIAAGVVHMARDRNGPKIAKQFLIYPMLDDRNMEPDEALEPFATWNYDDNYTGWKCYLDDAFGTDSVSPYAAPVRDSNFADLPPTFIDVGELDIFRDESINYANQLIAGGSSVELHVYPGASHGFDVIASDTDIGRLAWQARFRAVKTLDN